MRRAKIDFDKLMDLFPYKKKLKKLKKAIVGFVGFGCAQFSGMFLARCGIRNFIIIDADVFKPIDVSRNLFCFTSTIGKRKVEVSEEFFKDLNPKMDLKVYNEFLTEKNINIFDKADVIVEATGHPAVLKMLLDYGKRKEKPIITFRIQGSKGAVSILSPRNKKPLTNKFIEIRAKTKNVHPILSAMIHILISNGVMKILLKGKNLVKFPKIYFVDIESLDLLKIVNFADVENEFLEEVK